MRKRRVLVDQTSHVAREGHTDKGIRETWICLASCHLGGVTPASIPIMSQEKEHLGARKIQKSRTVDSQSTRELVGGGGANLKMQIVGERPRGSMEEGISRYRYL